ncbi:MAG: M23 family metallopeptidase [Deltaproteobacteria bacterium]|nr:M23 family metallopeptidase [Deltaproteobacteria bacterium]
MVLDSNGNFVNGGELLYASMNTRVVPITIYRYQTADGEIDMYDAKGCSVRKTLMATPIDGARLSSSYGMRRHPILGYTRMHKGLDFAAPSGTPIMAAGDGVIEFAGKKGGYGNYISIRHANGYQTAYGHMKGFASGIKKGARVKQGNVIGYVGSTGVSTGPHLHYEVLYNKKHVNPASVKTPSGRILKDNELEDFLRLKHELESFSENKGHNPAPKVASEFSDINGL